MSVRLSPACPVGQRTPPGLGSLTRNRRVALCCRWLMLVFGAVLAYGPSQASARTVSPPDVTLHYFPAGPIYEFRWKVLELALLHTRNNDGGFHLRPYPEDVTQDRGVQLLEAKAIDVIALGTNAQREARMLPIKIDIQRGMVGFRILIIRAADQPQIARMSDADFRRRLTFGLNTQWADLPTMQAAGYSVETTTSYENLFSMLADKRFDAFPRGLNEARREMDARRQRYPTLAVEQSKALYFPFPIYFWVNKNNAALARRIERGMRLAMQDGTMRSLFQHYYADEIAEMKTQKRHVIRLDNPVLPAGTPVVDTSWWWQ